MTDGHGSDSFRRTHDAEDAALLRALARMWADLDAPPPGLADDLVASLAGVDLDEEWELMRMVSGHLAGVRASSDVATFEFDLGSVSLMVRVAPESPTTGRVDGWLTSASGVAGVRALLLTDEQETEAAVDHDGRFEFAAVRGGRLRLRFLGVDGASRLQTPDMHF